MNKYVKITAGTGIGRPAKIVGKHLNYDVVEILKRHTYDSSVLVGRRLNKMPSSYRDMLPKGTLVRFTLSDRYYWGMNNGDVCMLIRNEYEPNNIRVRVKNLINNMDYDLYDGMYVVLENKEVNLYD